MPDDARKPDWDIVIVGCGPVGLLAAILLGLGGWQVMVAERRPVPYPLPRAVTFDHETARLLASAGLSSRLAGISEAASEYEWRNAAGQVLLRFAWDRPGASGWPRSSMFSQPALEELLTARTGDLASVRVRRGLAVTAIAQAGDHVTVTVQDDSGHRGVVRASYVIGCDGANSLVRQHMATTVTDLGFRHDWLIVDVLPDPGLTWCPPNLQICDPARPSTAVSGGPGRRRFEFMRLPHETMDQLNRAEMAWSLLRPWRLTPANAVLERHAVYTFQARWADRWRDGRVLLAGDAAHLMPPFAGQGLCSGLRDAANLAWKLSLVLGGQAAPALLDSYTAERSPHAQQAIRASAELGKVICILDPAAAAERDRAMNAAGGGTVLDGMPDTALAAGVLGRGATAAGELCPQGHVAWRGRAGLFDEVVGTGFAIVALFDPAAALSRAQLRFCQAIGARLVRLARPGEYDLDAVADTVGVYHSLLSGTGRSAVIIRPDFYIFGMTDPGGLGGLVDDLRGQLAGHQAGSRRQPDVLGG
jgi:flavoprotein hydroxylase